MLSLRDPFLVCLKIQCFAMNDHFNHIIIIFIVIIIGSYTGQRVWMKNSLRGISNERQEPHFKCQLNLKPSSSSSSLVMVEMIVSMMILGDSWCFELAHLEAKELLSMVFVIEDGPDMQLLERKPHLKLNWYFFQFNWNILKFDWSFFQWCWWYKMNQRCSW